MHPLTVISIAVALAMDCFAVSITFGLRKRRTLPREMFTIAACFGLFQAGMPVVGWLAGKGLLGSVEAYDHWVAFGLLGAIGAKMIHESFEPETHPPTHRTLELGTLLVLGIATSIDALAVGITFAVLDINIWFPILIIGLTSFAMSWAGVHLGKRYGGYLGRWMELAGGLLLILIGFKILYEHTF